MTFFQTIIALSVAFFTLNSIVPDGQKKVFLVLLFLPIFFLLFLVIRLDKLIRTDQNGGFVVSLLRFFEPRLSGAE